MQNWAYNHTEKSLEERERLQRLILENAPVGIITVDLESRIHSVNPFLCTMLGYSTDELLARSIEDIVHPEDRTNDEVQYEQLLRGEIVDYDVEGRFIRKDGSEVSVEFHVNLVSDQQGEPQFLVGQVQDLTPRKLAEKQKRHRDELLRLTFENAPIGMAITDADRNIVRANRVLCSLLGYSQEELQSIKIGGITFPDDMAETEQQLQRLWRNEIDHYEIEKRYLRKDGSILTCQSHVSIILDQDDAPLMSVGQLVDITEQVRATREMQAMRTYLKNMIDSMPSMLVAVDPDGVVTQWNKVAEQTTGLSAQETVGRPARELLPMNDAQVGQLEHAIISGEQVKAERLPVTMRGERRLMDVLAYPLRAEGDIGVVVRLDDVTDKVRMQEMMVQTEKMLSVGGLAAGMAHEINNPLGAILQSCQNIQRRLSETLPANRKVAEELGVDLSLLHRYMETRNILQFLERIQEAGERASKIVSDMLSFSRRSELHYQSIDIAELLETAVRLASSDFDLKKEYDIKQVKIVRDFDTGLAAVECDRTEIEQVVLNLIVNAAHAMAMNPAQQKPATITLHTRQDGEYARIEVSDNGPGMDEETRRRIFEPFFTTKDVGIGTGLGLSVSYFIIYDQHKGSMQVESAPGKGAKFIIRLPLRQS